jgi:hypothetical protein
VDCKRIKGKILEKNQILRSTTVFRLNIFMDASLNLARAG